MGFEFEEVTDTVTGELCIDMTHIPEEAYIDRHKQIIKVSNYHRNYRNKLEMERIEEEYQSKFATPSLWIAIKNYLDKLFK